MSTQTNYPKTTLPKSKEEAIERLQKLEDDITLINLRLELTVVFDYKSEEEYQIWRKRAISALLHKTKEVMLLGRFIKPVEYQENESIETDIEDLKKFVSERLEDLNYRRQYFDISEMPNDLTELDIRRIDLINIKKVVMSISKDLRLFALDIFCTAEDINIARKPIVDVLNSIELEFSVIKQKRILVAQMNNEDTQAVRRVTGKSALSIIRFLFELVSRNPETTKSLGLKEYELLMKIGKLF
ncbi:MAG: hypothetical protein WC087_03840 [Candidatus Paceibacterota bacterium]